MNILITQIGNRNFTYKEQVYSKSVHKTDFRNWSEDLWSRYEETKTDLSLNIINPLLENESYDKIYLLYSDQTEFSRRTDQDTLYAASIVRQQILDNYKYEKGQIECVAVTSDVTKNKDLMLFYRAWLRRLLRHHRSKSPFYTICDAGGTAQQKMCLKIMAEFVLAQDRYEVKYVQRNTDIIDVDTDEFRSVIAQEQAIGLIHRGEYDAAASILGIIDVLPLAHKTDGGGTPIKNFTFMWRLYSGDIAGAKKNHHNSFTNNQDCFDYVVGLSQKEAQKHYPKISLQKIQELYLKFHKTKFLFNIGRYTDSLMSMALFYEQLLELASKRFLPEEEFGKRNKEKTDAQIKNAKELFKRHYSEYYNTHPKFQIDVHNLATRVMLIKAMDSQGILGKLAKCYSPYIQHSDDSIKEPRNTLTSRRNKIAHEGKTITKQDVSEGGELSYITKLLNETERIFGLGKITLFSNLNKHLVEVIRTRGFS